MSAQFGNIFPEEITKSRRYRKIQNDVGDSGSNYKRIFFFIFLLVFGLGILLTKLFAVTIIEGNKYRELAQENRVRERKIDNPRGIIYDRNGIILAQNIPLFIETDGQLFYENKPATLSARAIETVARQYNYGSLFAHVIGYTGEINEEELNRQKSKWNGNYSMGDIVGKMGIEETYDETLRGTKGKQLYEVDSGENEVRLLGKIEPVPGKNLTLTLDEKLQEVVAAEMSGKKGAVIVSNPNTGEVLALYSSPSFDPNKFVHGDDIEDLLLSGDQPMFDRVISGLYPPGSTFKIVTAAAALESGAITRDTKFEDTGVLTVGDFSFGNWYFSQYGKKEGWLDIVGAIRRSNDIFFYKTGELTGIKTIASYARRMGLESILGIDIKGEEKGIMPDADWLKKTRGENWYLGNTYHVAIGQGDLLVSPLQVNYLTNIVAGGGRVCQPYLVKDISGNGNNADGHCRDINLKKDTLSLIAQGMKEACSTGGTGWPLFDFKVKNDNLAIDGVDFLESQESSFSAKPMVGITTACKTGTAEFGDPKNHTHAWITVFAPVAKPQISVTVLVEEGGEGSSVGGPIAKKILERWFGERQ